MTALAANLTAAPDTRARYRAMQARIEQRLAAAALEATDTASKRAQGRVRAAMRGARLGGLSNAIGQTSDKRKGDVHHTASGFSASGIVYVRSRSPRTLGAIEAYTEGASITPKRGRWLWIPTPEAGRVIGSGKDRRRLTPAGYEKAGSPMGPLIMLKFVNGRPLLAVRNVGKSEVGARGGRVRTRTKSGRLRKGDRAVELAVMFIAIPATSRAARVDVPAIMRAARAELQGLFVAALRKETRP